MVEEARTPYFVRMDADDIMHPERLQKQLTVLEANDDDTVVGSSAYSIDTQSRIVGRRRTRLQQRTGIAAAHSFIHPTVSATTAWFRRNRYSDSFIFHRAQDAELWCRTSQYSKFIVIDEPLLFYREAGTFSLSNYIGTRLGVIHLITTYGNSPWHRFLPLLGVELAKTGIACLAETHKKTDWFICKHWYTIGQAEMERASNIIAAIEKSSLPVRRTNRPKSEYSPELVNAG